MEPTALPSPVPTLTPTTAPTLHPSPLPTSLPTGEPSPLPTPPRPTAKKFSPTVQPTLGAPVVLGLTVVTAGAQLLQRYTLINPSKKVTVYADWTATDPTTT